MSSFQLSDREQQHFNELFASLDVDKQKKLDLRRTGEFLSKCDLPIEQFEQILEVCGANRLGHFGRSQFYIALKLIALAQNAYELSAENLSKPDIPLPLFYCERSDLKRSTNPNALNTSPDTSTVTKKSGYLPPPPSSTGKASRNRLGQHMQRLSLDSTFGFTLPIDATDACTSRSISTCLSSQKATSTNVSQATSGTASSDCHLPENCSQLIIKKEEESIGSECSSPEFIIANEQANGSFFMPLKPWQELESRHQQFRGLEQAGFLHVEDDAHHHLLGNEENEPLAQALCVLNGKTLTSYRCFTNEDEEQIEDNSSRKSPTNGKDTNALAVDANDTAQIDLKSKERRPSTDDNLNWINGDFELRNDPYDEDDDVWTISDQQLRYFHSKFMELSGGTCKPLAGSEVRSFLEKSKLPLTDLKKIWQLSDLDQDGQLSLSEFCIAVQLIVLRRNQVELPDILPKSLQPERWVYRLSLIGLQINTSVDPSEIALLDQPNSPPANREWTKFSNSPEPNASATKTQNDDSSEELSESAASMQPAKFEHIELDPRIPHPIAVKVIKVPPPPPVHHLWNHTSEVSSVKNAILSPDALAKYEFVKKNK